MRAISELVLSKIIQTCLRNCLNTLFLCAVVSVTSYASADTTAIDGDDVLLTIHGNIEGDADTEVVFDIASLTSLGATTFTASVPWTAEPVEYTGVRINILLKHVGAKSNEFIAKADNNYSFKLSNIDFEKYPVIVAYKKNGALFGVRELGPLLIMFPFDDYPELLTEKNKGSAVWQLTELRVL